MGKGKKAPKTPRTATLVDVPAVAEEQAPEQAIPTRTDALRARWSSIRVSATVFSVGGVIAFLLGGWAFGPYIGGGVELATVEQTCKTLKGHEICVPRVSDDGAALVKVTSDGWARYADGARWTGSDWR